MAQFSRIISINKLLLKSLGFVGLFLSFCFMFSSVQAASGPEQERPTTSATRALAPVLLVHGGDTEEADQWYHDFMDYMFGVGNWDEYNLPEQGLPNPPELLLSVLGQYQGVLWHLDSSGLNNLTAASSILADYIRSAPGGAAPGKLLLVAPPLYSGFNALQGGLDDELGIHRSSAPAGAITIPEDKVALALVDDLPNLYGFDVTDYCTGLQPAGGSEILYRMEYCALCYHSRRPPFDPVVAVRQPDRQTSFYAQSIIFSVPLHTCTNGSSALVTMLQYHFGFVPTWAMGSGSGKVQLSINNAGYVGNFFNPAGPSMVYPYPGYVEHLYHGGIWVGARLPDGSLRVSTSSDQYNNLAAADEVREFIPSQEEIRILSNIPGNENYHPEAIAPWQMECSFTDYAQLESGNHTPLGIKVLLRATSWNEYPINDGVVLEYHVVNISGADLRDVYFGFFCDTTVGNTTITDPYYGGDYSIPGWNYYDDVNGGYRPGDLAHDPDIWMMWEHDDDGDDGWATSWVGCRFLSSSHTMTPADGTAPVSYNSWRYGHVPAEDDTYWDIDGEVMLPGRYQAMSNGDFDSGVTQDDDFTVAHDWVNLLSTGPVPSLAAGDTLRATYVLLGGIDEWDLIRSSSHFAQLAANNWNIEATPVVSDIPHKVSLAAAVPNPFNPTTEISFSLDQAGYTLLEVHSIDGRLVSVLVNDVRQAGEYKVSWNGRDSSGQTVASGMYLYRLSAPGGTRLVGHMTLLK